jgi:hypothetical protein
MAILTLGFSLQLFAPDSLVWNLSVWGTHGLTPHIHPSIHCGLILPGFGRRRKRLKKF